MYNRLTLHHIYSPVCGSDSKTYSNGCELRRTACVNEVNLSIKHAGTCRKTTSNSEETDGQDDIEGIYLIIQLSLTI